MDTEKSFGSSWSRIFDSLIRESSFLLAMFSTRFRFEETCDSQAVPGVSLPLRPAALTEPGLGQNHRGLGELGPPRPDAAGVVPHSHRPLQGKPRAGLHLPQGCRQCGARLNPAILIPAPPLSAAMLPVGTWTTAHWASGRSVR